MTKIRYILFLLFIQLIQLNDSFGQFYPVPNMNVDLRSLNTNFNSQEINEFSISNFITVAEFNDYLKSIKNDSTTTFYRSQIPSSLEISTELINAILSDETLQNEPMPGVSWTVARNYCKWFGKQKEQLGKPYMYDIPSLIQVLAFEQFYAFQEEPILENWTLTSYDESSLYYHYHYDAFESDPPALKRKVIAGGSYHSNKTRPLTGQYGNYEYQDSSSRYVGFRIVRTATNHSLSGKQKLYQLFIDNEQISFGILENHLNGQYQEQYESGKIKVLGEFVDGQRNGVWTIWDSIGTIKLQRYYTNNMEYKLLYPLVTNPFEALYKEHPSYNLKRNEFHFYPYNYIEERSISFTTRLWREISVINEPELFGEVDFKTIVKDFLADNNQLFLYGSKGDFKRIVDSNTMRQIKSDCESWDFSRFIIKEDVFFNVDDLKSQTRPISINFYKETTDSTPSFTVYFPHLRKYLAKIDFNYARNSSVLNLDDFFFFSCYRGEIIDYSNYANEISVNNDWEIELLKLVKEHQNWMILTR